MRRRVFAGCVSHSHHATPGLQIACGGQSFLLVQILVQLVSIQLVDNDSSGEGRLSCAIHRAIFESISAHVYGG